MSLEVKAAGGADDQIAMNDLLYTFERFKETNEQRLEEIERKTADPLTEERLSRIDQTLTEQKAALDTLSARASRPAIGGDDKAETGAKSAFEAYMRSGLSGAPELKSLSTDTNEGGVLAPEETEARIGAALRTVSPFRQIATVRRITANAYRKPVATGSFVAGWTAETSARAQSATPQIQPLDFPTMELFAMPAATQTLLDDAIVDVGAWIAEEVQAEFAQQESAAFVNGNGTSQPMGFMSYPRAADDVRAFGELGTVAGSVTGDSLLDLVYALEQSYRAGGRFVMNKKTASDVRKLKDADGNYLWAPGLAAGQPSTLSGFPVMESEDMADAAAGQAPIAFGDFARGYLIIDRQGVQVLRDPYSAKPYVLFYTTKRVGGGVQDFAAIKLLQM